MTLKLKKNIITRKSKKTHKSQTLTWMIIKDHKIMDNSKEADRGCLYHLHITVGGVLWILNTQGLKQTTNMRRSKDQRISLKHQERKASHQLPSTKFQLWLKKHYKIRNYHKEKAVKQEVNHLTSRALKRMRKQNAWKEMLCWISSSLSKNFLHTGYLNPRDTKVAGLALTLNDLLNRPSKKLCKL